MIRIVLKLHGRVLVLGCAIALAGCGSIVYKETAETYVTVGRAFSAGFDKAAQSSIDARNKRFAVVISADPSCPVTDSLVLVRPSALQASIDAPQLESLINKAGLQNSAACKALLLCERGPCAGTCFLSSEWPCVTNVSAFLKRETNKQTKAQEASTTKTNEPTELDRDADLFERYLDLVQYGRKRSAASWLVSRNMTILTDYLDLLEKLSRTHTANAEDDAKALTGRITQVTDGISTIQGKDLSAGAKATRKAVNDNINALGKLAKDAELIVRNARDASGIKKTVRENGASVKAVLATLGPLLNADQWMNLTRQEQAIRDTRAVYAAAYQSPHAARIDRLRMLDEIGKLEFPDGDAVIKSTKKLITKVSEAHDTLVQLVENPTDEQRRKIAVAAFYEVRDIVLDIFAIVNLHR